MRSYQADLSRRLGPVFAEQAAYKPTHVGYPSAYPAAGARA